MARYDFNGDNADSSGWANTMTATGSVGADADRYLQANSAYRFTGGKFGRAAPVMTSLDNVTLTAWFRQTAWNGWPQFILINGGGGDGYGLFLDGAAGNVVSGMQIEPITVTPIDPVGQVAMSGATELNYTGGFLGLLNPFSLLLGVMTLLVFTVHGAIYLRLKTAGEVREAAGRVIIPLGGAAAVVAVAALLWVQVWSERVAFTLPVVLVAAVCWLGALFMALKGRDGWAFILSSLTIGLAVTALFLGLFPNVMPSTVNDAFNLDIYNASSQQYTLTVMTIVAVIMTPIVLVYQGWTFWVFRKRISTSMIPPQAAAGRSDDRFAGASS